MFFCLFVRKVYDSLTDHDCMIYPDSIYNPSTVTFLEIEMVK
jgi:hypothetical protein